MTALARKKPTEDLDLVGVAPSLETKSPEEILAWAATQFAPRLTFATGLGVEGCVLIDMIGRQHLPIDLFILDTGVLFPETYALWRTMESRYGLTIRSVVPTLTLDEQAQSHGERLWERDPDRCCRIRKVMPLRRALAGFDAWISAIRRDQTANRAEVPVVEQDAKYGLLKISPLARWTTKDVWNHIHRFSVPYNPLHDQGFPSIGCAPCTSAVTEGEDPRAGRWRGKAKTECGLHAKEPSPSPAEVAVAVAVAAKPLSPLTRPLLVPRWQEQAFTAHAQSLASLTLGTRSVRELERLGLGAALPLRGFLGWEDYQSVLARAQLADGTFWPHPLVLPVPLSEAARLAGQTEVALRDEAGRLWGTLRIGEVYSRNLAAEARALWGTDDPAEPRVVALLAESSTAVGGEVQLAPLPPGRLRAEASWVREQLEARGWSTVAHLHVAGLFSRVDEHQAKRALELVDGLVVTVPGDELPALLQPLTPALRVAAAQEALARYFPLHRVLLVAVPVTAFDDELSLALMGKRLGATHCLVSQATSTAMRLRAGVGLEALELAPAFVCRACGGVETSRTCPHPLSFRETGAQLLRPEVRELLVANAPAASLPVLSLGRSAAALKAAADAGAHGPGVASGKAGFILWFTGLSGAGKSTLAQAVRLKLAAEQSVEVLDGDELRLHLSRGLGFSREDRDQNVHRIGFLARVLARNGVAAIAAAISPYASTRDELRRLATDQGVAFVEVFAHAELSTLVARDEKGLYRKALAGELTHFTGVDDPYEPPSSPDVVVRSDQESVEEGAAPVVAALRARGLLRSEPEGPS